MLEREMLITTKPRRGHYVRTFTKREIIDVLELREALEVLGARRATRYITESQKMELRKFFKEIDVEVEDLIKEAARRAEEVIEANKKYLDDLKEALLKKETLEAKEVIDILKGAKMPHSAALY